MRRIAFYALGSLKRNPMIAAVTVAGVAIGTLVVATVLVVDANTTKIGREPAPAVAPAPAPGDVIAEARATPQIRVLRSGAGVPVRPGLVPTQEGELAAGAPAAEPPAARGGEADYQAMRIAVRLASLLAFLVGAVIVFYTMR